MERIFSIQKEADMLLLGTNIGQRLSAGSFVALYGDLGAGKSVLTRGIGKTFGIESMASPTFTIVQEYPTDPPLFHFDAYRLSDADELYAIGFDDYVNANGIVVMEWANLVTECLPKERLDITIIGSGTEFRTVRLEPHGETYEKVVASL